MAQLKAHEFETALARGRIDAPIVLIYGPDRGLVSERASRLAKESGVDLTDDFSVVRLEAGDLQGDPARLADAAYAIGLFGGKRLIWLKNAGNERGLQQAVEGLIATPPEDCLVLIEAGDLKKGTGLRKAVESARAALAVPCYADDARALQTLIGEALAADGLRITNSARERLSDLLGGDRLASRGEIAKLALYARGKETIDDDDVLAVIGDASALSVDETVDAALVGDVAGLDMALRRLAASKSSLFLALQAGLRQFQALEPILAEIESGKKTVASALQEAERRIHFKRKAAFQRALRLWTRKSAAQAAQHLQTAVLESRQRPLLEESVVRQALLAVAVRAARSRQR